MKLFPFSLFLLHLAIQISCSTPVERRMDRLLIFHRFKDAKDLLDSAPEMPENLCTFQIIARCIDLRNYRRSASEEHLMQISCSLTPGNSSTGLSVKQINYEATEILQQLIPFAFSVPKLLTRALNAAIFHNDYDLIFSIISNKKCQFTVDDSELTPLMAAIRFNRQSIFIWLLELGLDVHFINSKGENLVHIWARQSNFYNEAISSAIINLITQNCLNWQLENARGETPLSIAKKSRNFGVLFKLNQLISK